MWQYEKSGLTNHTYKPNNTLLGVKQCSFHILGYPMQWKHSSKCSRKYLQPHHNSTITPYRELGSCKQTACQLLWLDGRVTHTHTHTHTRLTALFPGLPGRASTRKVKPISILPKQETVSGSGISWAICKPAPSSRQITTPVPHHSIFYTPDALPATQPTASKLWRPN